MELSVPELGEGIEQATVVRVLVTPGTAVEEGQDLVEVETEKSTMSIPAPMAGIVERVHVQTGDKVRIGSPVLTIVPQSSGSHVAPPERVAPTASSPIPSPPTSHRAEKVDIAARDEADADQDQPVEAGAPGTARTEVVLPNLGEGIAGGTVVNVLVKPGDRVDAEQTLVEVETEKAAIPVPSPGAGSIQEVRVRAGDQVKVGQVLLVMQAEGVVESTSGRRSSAPAVSQPTVPSVPSATLPHLPNRSASTVPVAAPPMPTAVGPAVTSDGNHRPPVPASPAARRLARELGIDLHQVIGSARGGRVTIDDVKAFVRTLTTKGPATPPSTAPVTAPPLPDFARYGPIERKPFTALRKTIARNLTLSWSIAPQVTQHDLADITELEASRKSFVEAAPKGAPKVTMTVLAIKACVAALKAFPHFNASYDPHAGENGELIIKKYYHIGIAVDTERGLVVPVIRNADQKSIGELAKEVAQLAEKARAGKLVPDEMRGGTFTITNLGGIGGTAFSPIINYPEVAILGLSRSSWQPVVREGRIEPRLMLPLSLTYDHRVIDGADGARFCARLATLFSDPMRMFFES